MSLFTSLARHSRERVPGCDFIDVGTARPLIVAYSAADALLATASKRKHHC